MDRTGRLFALREELWRAGSAGRTADALAAVFEVSARTIKRDVSTLQHSGFPVWARPGPGGGYVVDPAATLPPVNFSSAEAAGLAAAVAAHRGQPFDGEARAALLKVLAVMDAGAQSGSEDLARRIWIDQVESASTARARRAVELAVREQVVVVVHYADRAGQVRRQRVDPIFLAYRDSRWYLAARSRPEQAIVWFRLDRIVEAHATRERAADIPVEAVGTPPATAASVADT
jgi:predicted DNA-binding transcriptional regulator YafY